MQAVSYIACDCESICVQFSHDLDVNRKAEKKDLYTDSRTLGASRQVTSCQVGP
jgi:DsbC/DsbD-like thiol-disulfide interchange protein